MTIVTRKMWPSVEGSSWYFRFGLYVIIHLIILFCWQCFCSLWLAISWKYCLQTHFHRRKRIFHQNGWSNQPGKIVLTVGQFAWCQSFMKPQGLSFWKKFNDKKKNDKILSHSTILTVSQERMCHLEISSIKCTQHLFDFCSIFDTGFF